VDHLTYEILAWLAAGNRLFRPREATAKDENEFRDLVAVLAQLRGKGWVSFLDGHISRTGSGIYLAVGPVLLTPEGLAALESDVRLGARAPWPGLVPWRQ
jgi:hypothetical protein